MQESIILLSKTLVSRQTRELPTKARYGDSAFLLLLRFDAHSRLKGSSRCFTSAMGVTLLRSVLAAEDNSRKGQIGQRTHRGVHTRPCKVMARICDLKWHYFSEPESHKHRLTKIHPKRNAPQLIEFGKYAGGCFPGGVMSGVIQRKGCYHSRATIGWTSERQLPCLSPPVSSVVRLHLFLPAAYFAKTPSDHEKECFRSVRALRLAARYSVRDTGRRVPDDIRAGRPCGYGEKSASVDKVSAVGALRNFHAAAVGGKVTTAEAFIVERRSAPREEGGLPLSDNGKKRAGSSNSNKMGGGLKKDFSSVCSASSQMSEKFSARLSDLQSEYSAHERTAKGDVVLVRMLPQSLAEVEKWEPSELVLKQKQQVVQWKYSKVCVVCKKEVQAGALDKAESACEKAWRFMSGYARSHRVCPLLTNMRLMQYAEAPLKDRVRFDARLRRDKPVKTTIK